MANIIKSQTKTNQEKNMMLRREFEDHIRAQQEDLNRAYEIWDAYLGVNGSSWDIRKRATLREEGRHPWHFDIIGPKVETLAGSLTAEMPDIDWTPVLGGRNTATEAVRQTYFIDKELFNFDDVILKTVRDGCVHEGWIQMTESKKYNPAGNVSLEKCKPGYVVPSSYWITDDDRDLDLVFKVAYMDAEKMAWIYNKKSDAIKAAIKAQKENGTTIPLSTYQRELRQRSFRHDAGDEHRVIEKHWLKMIKKERLIGGKFNNDTNVMQFIPFPLSEDRELLNRFAEINEIDWTNVQLLPYEDKIHMVDTMTDLDTSIELESGKSRIQPKGLPFYNYTTMRINGHSKGIAESILDIQRRIDEGESYLYDMIGKNSGGSTLWNESLFPDPNKKQKFVKSINKPGYNEFADLDSVANPKIDITPQPVNPAVINDLSRLYNELLPVVSRVSDAMSAISQSEDSGVLFERKFQMNRIANIMYDKYLKRLLNNLGEGYFYQWKITYGDVEREITSADGTNTVVLNKRDFVNGRPVIVNSVNETPRCRVVVTESTHSALYQLRQKMQLSDLIQNIPEGDNLRLQAALTQFFNTFDLPAKEKVKMEMANDMSMEKAVLQYITEITTMKAQISNNKVAQAQADILLSQLRQQSGAAQQPQQGVQPALTDETSVVQEVPENFGASVESAPEGATVETQVGNI